MMSLFNKFFKREKDNFVGINIGNRYIKGLIKKDTQITGYFIKENKDLADVLKDVKKERKFPVDIVKLSIKNPSCLVRCFPFPKMDKRKIREALTYEISNYIPFSPQEVYFDFAVLKDISSSEVMLLLGVAKKDFIDHILTIFDGEGLKVSQISLDSLCLLNLLLNTCKDKEKMNTSILDIGYSVSTLTIVQRGIPFITRDLSVNARSIFQVVSSIKNLPFSEIDKWILSLKNHKDFLELAQDSISNLCREVKNSFDYFEVNKGERVEKIYLSGGLASLKGIENFFKEVLGIETAVLDSLGVLNFSFSDEEFNIYKNSFAVTSGLVL
jgi:type IV pilus assembly protein PilM